MSGTGDEVTNSKSEVVQSSDPVAEAEVVVKPAEPTITPAPTSIPAASQQETIQPQQPAAITSQSSQKVTQPSKPQSKQATAAKAPQKHSAKVGKQKQKEPIDPYTANTNDVINLTPEEVADLLLRFNVEKAHVLPFIKERINGLAFLLLESYELNHLNLPLGPRKVIFYLIQQIRQRNS
jgi:hypothetical protein